MNKLLITVAAAALLSATAVYAADDSVPAAPESHQTAAPNTQGSEAGAPKRHHTGKHHTGKHHGKKGHHKKASGDTSAPAAQ